MQRRELFSSLTKPFNKHSKRGTIRPPYFKDEDIFFTNCINCETKDCSAVCEENIITIQDDGTPVLDFSKSGCTYCNLCAKSCKYETLKEENKQQIVAKIEIDVLSCLSWNQTMCFSCKDPCFENAIDFLAMFRPSINQKCTSCGFCVKVCPTGAIKVI